jgi:hypothetical protein
MLFLYTKVLLCTTTDQLSALSEHIEPCGSLFRTPKDLLVLWEILVSPNFKYDCDYGEEGKQEVQSRANYVQIQAFVIAK